MSYTKMKSFKNSCMLMAGLSFGLLGYGQAVQSPVDKQLRDPQRRANAGKADVIISKKKNVFDSTTFNKDTTKAATGRSGNRNAGKQHCHDKTRQNTTSPATKKGT